MRSYFIPALLLCSFLISICGCKDEAPKNAMALQPEVNIVTAGTQNVNVYTEYVGETYGKTDVEIQSRVEGWITGIHFKEGQAVEKGQLLYTVDDLPIKTKVDAANSRVAQANTQMVKMKSDLERVEPLTAMNALSKRDLDAATASYEASKNEVEIAKASLRNAEIELSYTRIKAPVSGIIGISKLREGDYVSRTNIGAPLNVISALGGVRVRFSISENEYLVFARKIQAQKAAGIPGEIVTAQLILGDGTLFPEQGKLNIINRQVDPATGSLLLEAEFPNTSHLLKPGLFVKVKIKTNEQKSAVVIPQQAVNQMQNIYQVFVLNDSNQLSPRIIKPGMRNGSNWVVAAGLKAGEKIAVIGNASIKPGMIVKPTEMKWNYDSTSAQ